MGLQLVTGGKKDGWSSFREASYRPCEPESVIIENASNGYIVRVIDDDKEDIYLVPSKPELLQAISTIFSKSNSIA